MTMTNEIRLFLGLKITQLNKGFFVTQPKYAKELFKKFGMEDSKLVYTPKDDESPRINQKIDTNIITRKTIGWVAESLVFGTTFKLFF